MKNNKYARNRRKILGADIGITFCTLILCIAPETDFEVGLAVCAILFCLIFWFIYFWVITKFKKQMKRSNTMYNGNLEAVLENCPDRGEEYALLDIGLFSYSSGRISLFSDIICLTKRDLAMVYQLWIYENNGTRSFMDFEIGEERDCLLEKVRDTHPEITIWDKEGLPSKEDLDRIVRK
ncbi:hypothetical protein [Ruminococcus albus]|uniref:Uncharacterized protein n=1 Tax=Ruminococcus albus TaxID=1264 RepID=A0A1I1DDP9_RUMAL|nr:hypothetical protein [Ruminococcus albus]SFB73041.1 hypothetical protein SAMN02910406_00374 [Ruminococcus albus]